MHPTEIDEMVMTCPVSNALMDVIYKDNAPNPFKIHPKDMERLKRETGVGHPFLEQRNTRISFMGVPLTEDARARRLLWPLSWMDDLA